jgi:sugar phosphate isomerase/epimerase
MLEASVRAWKRIPIAAQLWCVRQQLATEIPGTLQQLSKLGLDAVELENAFGKSGAEWRKHLDAAKTKAWFHHRLDELQGEKISATVEFNQAVGNRNLIIRSLAPAVYQSAELLKTTADAVNEVAERLRPHRMRVGYHNHTTDFNRIDGEYWWNLFADKTSKDVILQLDTGNASEMAGVTVVDLIRRNAGRTISMHVKPYSKKNPDAYLGADELDWPAIMTAAESTGGIECDRSSSMSAKAFRCRIAESKSGQLQEAEKLNGGGAMSPSFDGARVLALESRRATEISTSSRSLAAHAFSRLRCARCRSSRMRTPHGFAGALIDRSFDVVVSSHWRWRAGAAGRRRASATREAFVTALSRTRVAHAPEAARGDARLAGAILIVAPEPNTWRSCLLRSMRMRPSGRCRTHGLRSGVRDPRTRAARLAGRARGAM